MIPAPPVTRVRMGVAITGEQLMSTFNPML
jgi:hypothetical protein